MTQSPDRRGARSAVLTSFQAVILALFGVLVCLLAGAFIYILWPQPSPQSAVQAGQSLPAFTPTPKPVRTLPATFTPQSIATLRPTSTPTTAPPTPVPPQACIPPESEIQAGMVVEVRDGQSLQVDVDGQVLTIVYAGISVPPTSRAKNSELVSGRQVILVSDSATTGDTGQILRYVLAGDRFINYELVRQGYAQALDLPELACAQVLHQAEVQARADQLILWAPTRIPTLTFVPTVGSNPADLASCDCSVSWSCTDFRSQSRAQACFNACNDYNSRLDEDHDGLACENLP